MLRISIADDVAERRWIIQGRLVGLWVSELERAWETSRHESDKRRCIVDLTDVTTVDKHGERVLKAMREAGAVLVACGLYTSHIVEDIDSQCRPVQASSQPESLKTTNRRK